jgi:hypothetical protein
MPVIIIYLIGLTEFKSDDPVYYKILAPDDEFLTLPDANGIWKTEFKYKSPSYDPDIVFELWTTNKKTQKKLSTFRLSLEGHSDTIFENATIYWYPLHDLKNTKLGLKIGSLKPKVIYDDDLELEITASAQ